MCKNKVELLVFSLFLLGGSLFAFKPPRVVHKEPENTHFVVVIPSFNNGQWVSRNFRSALDQEYTNCSFIFINDASTDSTGLLAAQCARNYPERTITIINNTSRCGALENIYRAVHSCSDRSVIVTLDGDDWFASAQVLARLNREYMDTSVWMTYGQYLKWPHNHLGGSHQVPAEVIQDNSFRDHEWCTSHLRTFYAGLFKKIKQDDLIYEGATFFPAAWDLAFMIPMLEMAGKHSRFIDEILYIYNLTNPISDHRINVGVTGVCANIIRSKSRYTPLPELFEHD